MPASPKLRDAARNVWIVEVFEIIKPEDFAKADCHVGISRKVKIYLEGKSQRAQPCRRGADFRNRHESDFVPNHIYLIGKQHLLAESDDEPAHALRNLIEIGLSADKHLSDIRIAHNRTCDKLRKQRHIGRKSDKITLRQDFPPVDIYDIGDRLKCVKRNSNRQGNVQKAKPSAGDCVHRLDEKIRVFEKSENRKVSCDAQDQKRPGFCDNPPHHIVEEDGKSHHRDIFRLAPALKNQAGNQKPQVPHLQKPFRNQKVQKQGYRQECHKKHRTAEYHIL